jgi:hypothetical protein
MCWGGSSIYLRVHDCLVRHDLIEGVRDRNAVRIVKSFNACATPASRIQDAHRSLRSGSSTRLSWRRTVRDKQEILNRYCGMHDLPSSLILRRSPEGRAPKWLNHQFLLGQEYLTSGVVVGDGEVVEGLHARVHE